MKKILIAEKSDTIRQIAETILRQNDYEVISVTSGEQLLTMNDSYHSDMIITSSDLYDTEHTPIYQLLNNSQINQPVPFLILISADEPKLPLDDCHLLTKPFDPKELLALVKGKINPETTASVSFAQTNTAPTDKSDDEKDDDLLDMALGIDSLDVTESEVMDSVSKAPATRKVTSDEDSGRVESLMIRDEEGEIDHVDHYVKPKKTDEAVASDSAGLELMSDQYGMEHDSVQPDSNSPTTSKHDYDWFLNELKTENESPSNDSDNKQLPPESEDLNFSDTSTFIDPITPAEKPLTRKSSRSDSVDNFIEEFKKEVEKISTDLTETVTISKAAETVAKVKKDSADFNLDLDNKADMEQLKKQFVAALAEKIAKNITDSIDSDKLISLLKQEILARKNNK